MKNLLKSIMSPINWVIKNIPYGDKVSHFLLLGALPAFMFYWFIMPDEQYAFAAGFMVALGKEVYDLWSGKGVASLGDFIAGVLGALLVLVK